MRILSKYTKYEGPDACLATSLFEYGMIWCIGKKSTKFIYGISYSKDGEYNLFNSICFENNIDIKKEFNWIDLNGVTTYACEYPEDWMKLSLPQKIYDICRYYGYEGAFGESYGGGFKIIGKN